VPLPLRLIAHMTGGRPEDYDTFHRWSDHTIGAEGRLDDVEAVTKAGRAYAEYANYISRVIEDRRQNPRDDLVSILTGAKDSGVIVEFAESSDAIALLGEIGDGVEAIHALHYDELIKMMVVLLVAGNETTRNGISGGMQLLIENPDERRKLVANPSLIRQAVEEMLRVATPIHSFGRTVTCDTELRGKRLERGQKILLAYSPANRDADQFDEPDTFRIDRGAGHLAFGIGNHFCLGANLARMEMRIALEQVLRRMPDIEYASDGPVLVPSRLVRTCAEMKVRFTPETPLAR
jgi:cholest-4-en-3-one 26-monooxygenase